MYCTYNAHTCAFKMSQKNCYVSICCKKLEDGELGSSARLLYMRHAKVVKVRNPLSACVLQVALTVWHICWFSFCASRRVLATYISIATCTHDMHCMIKPCPVCRNSGLKLKALGAHNTPWIINGCNNFS